MTGAPVEHFTDSFLLPWYRLSYCRVLSLNGNSGLCAMILKNNHGKPRKKTWMNRFWIFNRGFKNLRQLVNMFIVEINSTSAN